MPDVHKPSVSVTSILEPAFLSTMYFPVFKLSRFLIRLKTRFLATSSHTHWTAINNR